MATPLYKKLRLTAGMKAVVANPPANYIELLSPLPEEIDFTQEISELDFLHIFATQKSELDQLFDHYLPHLKYDAIFWISYPKGSAKVETDLSRNVFWDLLQDRGLRPVTQVAVDQTWSALRFRPTAEVGK